MHMSCYQVDKATIDLLVQAAMMAGRGHTDSGLSWYHDDRRRELSNCADYTGERANEVGQMLTDENRASVDARYNETNEPDVYTYERFATLADDPDPKAVLSCLFCYEYQACEHPGWDASEAHMFCIALQKKMVWKLIGDDQPWGVSDKDRTVRKNGTEPVSLMEILHNVNHG
jgi:hypothetical protein